MRPSLPYVIAVTDQILLQISGQIKKIQKIGSIEHEISIFWVPRRTLVSNKILEDEGILGDVNVSEFPMYFLPLEDDLLSLELGNPFMELYLVGLLLMPPSSVT